MTGPKPSQNFLTYLQFRVQVYNQIRKMDDKTLKLALKVINLNIEDLRERYLALLEKLEELEKTINNLMSANKN